MENEASHTDASRNITVKQMIANDVRDLANGTTANCIAPLRCHLYDIDFYRSERFCARNDFNFSSCQLTEPPRFTVIRVPDQSVEPRSRSRTIAYPSDSKVRSVYTGIWTSLMTVITLGSTLQLHVSSGSCASVILRSGVTHRGGQDRVLLVFSVNPKPRISRSPFNSIRFVFLHISFIRFRLEICVFPRCIYETRCVSVYWTSSILTY